MLYLKRKFKLHRLMEEEKGGEGAGGTGGGEGGGNAGGEGAAGGGAAGAGSGGEGGGEGKDEDLGKAWETLKSKYVGDDKTKSAVLGRYASFEDLANAQVALRERMAKGEIKVVLPKNATEDQVKAWRTENGIPESPDKYEIKRGDKPLPAEDLEMVKPFLERAHKANMSPQHVQESVDGFQEFIGKRVEAMKAKDSQDVEEVTNKLTVEWGSNYGKNKAMIEGLLTTLPASVAKTFQQARLPDGRGLLNHPDMMKGLLNWASEINPSGTVVPGGGGDLAGSIETELAAIRKVMATDRKAYNKDGKMQARMRELLSAQQKAKGQK